MKVSLIIITYNAPQYLALVLESVRRQRVMPFEVVVADDGSTDETRKLIDSLRPNFPCLLKHAWHEDDGFRIARIRNEAIKLSEGDYLIFSDGDLMLNRHFVADFTSAARSGMALIGTRLFLSEPFTQKMLVEGAAYKPFCALSGKSEKNWLNGVRIPNLYKFFQVYDLPKTSLRGGLLGVFRSDMLAVGGWDSLYEGWGSEDTDLIVRLIHHGLKARKLKHQGLTYHLWHPHNSRAAQSRNEDMLKACIREKRVKAINGL